MNSDRYVHPEFGFFSPTPRLRREIRMASFSLLCGIGIGAAAVIALSGNNTADDAPRGVGSASIISEDRTEPVLSYKSPQAIEKELNKDHTRKPDRSTADANSEDHKPKATTTCEGNNPSCGNKPRAKRTPAANEALAIGRAPLGRSDASAGMISAAPLVSSEPAQSTGSKAATEADRLNSDRPMNKKLHQIVRNRPPQGALDYRDARGASRIGRGYNRPAGELDRTYALDRPNGSRGFWEWSP
jgi:hypothetical protein